MFKSDHSRLGFPSKSAQSWKTLKNGCFWHCIVIIEWSRFFPGKPPCTFLVLIVVNIHAKKLRNPRCGSPGILLTDRRTDGLTNRGLTSTEVENWNVLTDMLNFSLLTSESTVWLIGLLRLLGRLGLLRLLDSKRPYSWFVMFHFLILWQAVTFWHLLNFDFFVFLTSWLQMANNIIFDYFSA